VNAYIDSSVVLRIVFGEERPLAEWHLVRRAISSVLLHVECRRAVDRERITSRHFEQVALYRDALMQTFETFEFIDVTDDVISLAAQAMPIVIRTLDAIHLATALDWQRRERKDFVFMTHDTQLADATRRAGFDVLGV